MNGYLPDQTPAGSVPRADVPGTDVPGTDVPGTDVPGTDVPGTVTVTGRGSVQTVPDSFNITIGIEASRPTVREAYSQAGAALAAVSAKLLSLGVMRETMSSSSLDVRVDSRWQEGAGTVVTGYTVTSTLAVTLHYDQGADDIVAAVVDAGHNSVRLNGMNPVVSDPTAAQEAARTAAWVDARRSAEQYAQLAGRQLGPVMEISEGQVRDTGPVPMFARAAITVEAAPLPLEAGHSTVAIVVRGTWQLVS